MKKMIYKGFSLIELMIALVIISILTATIYPSYIEHIIRAKRTDGQTALLDLANRMEHYYSEHNSYSGATLGISSATDIKASSLSAQGWYQLIIKSTDDNYILEARPLQTIGFKDKYCQTLTLNSEGIKNIANGPNGGIPSGSVANCW